MASPNIAKAVAFQVKVSGDDIPADRIVSWSVEQDLGQPGMCIIVVRNEDHMFSSKHKPGDEVIINVGDGGNGCVFSGDLVGTEPTYKANGENIVTLRAFDRLHRLSRARRSRTFVDMSDKEIVTRMVTSTGGYDTIKSGAFDIGAATSKFGSATTSKLGPVGGMAQRVMREPKSPGYDVVVQCGTEADVKHPHIYQHNQTDLEFMRLRAARLGYDVWVHGQTLYFDKPDSNSEPTLTLRYGDAGTAETNKESKGGKTIYLKRFTPRTSTARILSEVEVRGWDPVKKEEVIATVHASEVPSKLGGTPAYKAAGSLGGDVKRFNVDHPVQSLQEAQKLARAKLAEANMGFMTGDGDCRGTAELGPGVVVYIIVNPDAKNDRFNGKYLVVGATHRYSSQSTGDNAGYITSIRVARDGEGPPPETKQASD